VIAFECKAAFATRYAILWFSTKMNIFTSGRYKHPGRLSSERPLSKKHHHTAWKFPRSEVSIRSPTTFAVRVAARENSIPGRSAFFSNMAKICTGRRSLSNVDTIWDCEWASNASNNTERGETQSAWVNK